MPTDSSTKRPPLTDSPWYWLYVFATAGLVALVLMGPKYAARQSQLEQNYQGHQRANQHRVGLDPDTPLSSQEHTYIQLWPLYLVLFGLLAAGWVGLWWRRFHRPATTLPIEREVKSPEPAGATKKSPAQIKAARHVGNSH